MVGSEDLDPGRSDSFRVEREDGVVGGEVLTLRSPTLVGPSVEALPGEPSGLKYYLKEARQPSARGNPS